MHKDIKYCMKPTIIFGNTIFISTQNLYFCSNLNDKIKIF